MGKFERNDRKGGGRSGGKGGNGSKGSRGNKGGGSRHHKGNHTFKKGGGRPPSSSPTSQQQRHKKVEITFDPNGRREYLTGFSARKKERRAFGLAMQKVKDREAKLEERKEQREAQLERIEDIERNKVALRNGLHSVPPSGSAGEEDDDDNDDCDGGDNDDGGAPQRHRLHGGGVTRTFQDERTTRLFGGSVSVTTTFGIPPYDDDEDGPAGDEFYARKEHGPSHVDEAQRRAGDVANYMTAVKGTMGSKKRGASSSGGGRHGGRKGQHGASTMKGMGNASTLKMAKRTLAKFKSSKKCGGGGDDDRGRGGGKGKKGKGRR